MVGLSFVAGFFVAVVFAYVCTEYVLARFDARGRVLTGQGHPLVVIIAANAVSFALVWTSASLLIAASGMSLGEIAVATLLCLFAQAVWLSQHLWFYYRDHLRLRYE